MSLPVLIGFAGVLVAAVATGMLAGRCARQPRVGFVLWTAATLGLTIALAAQSMGFASGFGPTTFRAIQLFALLLAPLWLAGGLVELAVANDAARFGMRLISSALTVVASVILATDPLAAQPFSKAWPLTGPHFQPISLYVLDAVQAVALLAVLASVAMTAVRARSGPPVTAVVSVGLAVLMTAGQRFQLPAGAAYPLLSMVEAARVWFGVSRVGEPPRARASARRLSRWRAPGKTLRAAAAGAGVAGPVSPIRAGRGRGGRAAARDAAGPGARARGRGLGPVGQRGRIAGGHACATVRPDPDLHPARRPGRRFRPARRGIGRA